VLRALVHLCRHLPFPRGRRRATAEPTKAARLASFMAEHNRRPLNTDLRDAVLQGRKTMKHVFRAALLGGGAWVVVESARALSVF
jgi:hypothetical protein